MVVGRDEGTGLPVSLRRNTQMYLLKTGSFGSDVISTSRNQNSVSSGF